MRLVNDARLCNGNLRCCEAAPELLDSAEAEDLGGEWTVSIRGQSIDVPPGQEGAARAAVAACPEEAFSLIERDEGEMALGSRRSGPVLR